MPFAEIKATTAKVGLFTKIQKVQIYYTVATPCSNDAATFDPSLETIIFLHCTYVPQEFNDVGLRKRYNLIAMDSRGHGRTRGTVEQGFNGMEEAGDDVIKFMDAIKLKQAHVCGVLYGANVGLWAAIRSKARILSLMLISPLPQYEPEDVRIGRWEVWQCWSDGVLGLEADGMALAAKGAVQITFDGDEGILAYNMIMNAAFPACLQQWHGGEKGVKVAKRVAAMHTIERNPIKPEEFAKLAGTPVFICAGDRDALYPPPTEMRDNLKKANVVAELEIIYNSSASCNVTAADRVNHLYRTFLASNFRSSSTPMTSKAPSPGFVIASPYQDTIFPPSAGSGGDEDDDEDD